LDGGDGMRRRIEITNTTPWRTDDLRALILAGCTRVFDPDQKPVIDVIVKVARGRKYVTGCATIGGTFTTLRIGLDVADIRLVGAVIVHELGHLRGLYHRDMRGGAKWTDAGVPVRDGVSAHEQWLRANDWAVGMPLRRREPVQKDAPDAVTVIEGRLVHSQRLLSRWETKAKRAATAMRKLRRRITYYERRYAAALKAREDA
jgi:dual-action HEIGH metallo-peptidase